MHERSKLTKAVRAIAGVSLGAMVFAGMSGTVTASGFDDEKKVAQEKKDKTSKRKVRVIQTGKPVVVSSSADTIVVGSTSPHIAHKVQDDVDHKGIKTYSVSFLDEKHENAIEKIKASLKTVDEELKQAKNKSAKKSLKIAKNALKTSLKALEQSRAVRQRTLEIRSGHSERIAEALKDMEVYEGDIQTMRVEVHNEMGAVRDALREALGDVELEIDLDGDLKSLRIDSIRRAEDRLEGMEGEHLEALRRAEENLRRAREKLQKRMAEKQAEDEQNN